MADGFDEVSGRYQGLRPQQASSSQLPTLNTLIVKEVIAKQQVDAPAAPTTDGPISNPGGGDGFTTSTGYQPTPTGSTGGSGISPTAPSTTSAPAPAKRTTFTASLKLDPMRAGLQMGDFLDEVLSHLQALPGAEVNLSVEVHVKAPNGIDDATARVVLENSRSLKVDNPQMY